MSRSQRPLYPLQFRPVLKDYPWGGERIGTRLGRDVPPGPVAESWEISAHPDGLTVVENGRFAGRDLRRLLAELGPALVGTRALEPRREPRFPLLVKILDAREWLSVQVHPDDEYAHAHEDDFGKTEMWVVLDADPEAEILLGLSPGTDRASLEAALEGGNTPDVLHRQPVVAGDVLFVPPGTVHALGPGLLLVEIQQSSNVTYRLFDWNRCPPRPLHVEQALAVIDFDASTPRPVRPSPAGRDSELLVSCSSFRTERHRLRAGEQRHGRLDGSTFEIWGVLSGAAEVTTHGHRVELPAVSWSLLPAALGDFRLQAASDTTALRVSTPAPRASARGRFSV